ncbi:hypothetical protein NWP21_16350 [Anabaenopsis sp. FSS-46]|uniref:hypothetical protein n=1 Tax=Anabaenopsis sp. FSS-46 TaxID=2971766 RepID=UPI002475E535|nr:hypothetical protein [Anabaenopsis sp. FSS-46]MDH6100381.1 hypothetical protein [Anabaenopsis sp. FSS-46]
MFPSTTLVGTAIVPLDVPFDYADGNGDRPLMFPSTTLMGTAIVPLDVPFDYGDGNGDRP